MEENMPRTCKVNFEDPSILYQFQITILPDEGFWSGGKFKFDILVPEDYNIVVSSLLYFYVTSTHVQLQGDTLLPAHKECKKPDSHTHKIFVTPLRQYLSVCSRCHSNKESNGRRDPEQECIKSF